MYRVGTVAWPLGTSRLGCRWVRGWSHSLAPCYVLYILLLLVLLLLDVLGSRENAEVEDSQLPVWCIRPPLSLLLSRWLLRVHISPSSLSDVVWPFGFGELCTAAAAAAEAVCCMLWRVVCPWLHLSVTIVHSRQNKPLCRHTHIHIHTGFPFGMWAKVKSRWLRNCKKGTQPTQQ